MDGLAPLILLASWLAPPLASLAALAVRRWRVSLVLATLGLASPLALLVAGIASGVLYTEDVEVVRALVISLCWGPVQEVLVPLALLVVLSATISSMSLGVKEPSFPALMCLLGWLVAQVLTSPDVLSMYVSFEVCLLISALLVAYGGPRGVEASFKYLAISLTASALLLPGLLALSNALGSTSLAEVGLARLPRSLPLEVKVAAAMVIAGFAVKAGLVPLHTWLPDTYMAAPTPASAAIAGALPVMGIYGLLAIVTPLVRASTAIAYTLMVMGIASVLLGGLAALTQEDVKRALAYSSISQWGYPVIALATGTRLGVVAALVYTVAHSLAKTLLFVSSGALELSGGSPPYKGMKVSTWSFAAGALSLSGLPPLMGFIAKLMVICALLETYVASGDLVVGITFTLALLSALVTACYSVRRLWQLRFLKGVPAEGVREPMSLVASCTLLVVPLIALGLVPGALDPLLRGVLVSLGLTGGG